MSGGNKNPLTPDSLAADGVQGEGKARGHCVEEHSPRGCAALFLAYMAIDAATAQLNAYALATDDPLWGAVEAADLLQAARAALDGAT